MEGDFGSRSDGREGAVGNGQWAVKVKTHLKSRGTLRVPWTEWQTTASWNRKLS